jgi:uncharacterized repeat protein (TIGR01451 family)
MPPIRPFEVKGDIHLLRPVPRISPFHSRDQGERPIRPLSRTGNEAIAKLAPVVPAVRMPAAIASFDGLGARTPVTGGTVGGDWPPDTNGDVGPNHYIQAVNTAYAIYSKTGVLMASFTEDSLFGPSSANPCKGSSQGDPVVIYDPFADRWILTHFAFDVDSQGNSIPPFYECVAVSKTGDPVAGGWWLYPFRFDTGGTGPPVSTLGDYPKFGIWPDCLYMSANGYSQPSDTFNGSAYASFSRSDLESGAAVHWSLGFLAGSSAPFTMIPSNFSGPPAGAPAAGTPNYFVSEAGNSLTYNVRKFSASANCAAGTLGNPIRVSHATYFQDSTNDLVAQPGTSQPLDALPGQLMQKVQYRKLPTGESLWVVHTVQPTIHTPVAPQWAQIDVTGGNVATVPVQEQIYLPDTVLNRWLPSIAADTSGNMAIGYSTSNAFSPNYPGIAYSGRLITDALNSLPQTENILVSGSGSQTNVDRSGDYSSMSVDPVDGCTFWYTNEYYRSQTDGNNTRWSTHIGSFRFPNCGVPALAVTSSHTATFTQGQNGVYTLTVSNIGVAATNGAVTVTESVPSGLALVSMSGTGWTCPANTCTRSDSLLSGKGFPAITVAVNVSANAPPQLTNLVSVSGGGSVSSTATDLTVIGVVTAPAAGLAPSSISFGTIAIGSTAPAQAVTLTNSGTATLAISSVAMAGANPGEFSQTNSCGSIVAPGASCTIWVSFTPAAASLRSASLMLSDNATGSPQSIRLSGNVTPAVVSSHGVGIFRVSNGLSILDTNFNRTLDGADQVTLFAGSGMTPRTGDIAVSGDWSGTGTAKIGLYRPSTGAWFLDYNGNGVYDGPAVDRQYQYGGLPGDIPVVGDWNGSGFSKVGIFRQGFLWILTTTGTGTFSSSDAVFGFGGLTGCVTLPYPYNVEPAGSCDIPVVGDWNGSGSSKVGVFRAVPGTSQPFLWVLDTAGSRAFVASGPNRSEVFAFGGVAGDIPLVSDWNNTGATNVGVFRMGFFWVEDTTFNTKASVTGTPVGTDTLVGFGYGGIAGDQPIVGPWR